MNMEKTGKRQWAYTGPTWHMLDTGLYPELYMSLHWTIPWLYTAVYTGRCPWLYTRCVHMCSNVSRYSLDLLSGAPGWILYCMLDACWAVHYCTLHVHWDVQCEEKGTSMTFSSTSWTHVLWTHMCKMPSSNDFKIVSSDFSFRFR